MSDFKYQICNDIFNACAARTINPCTAEFFVSIFVFLRSWNVMQFTVFFVFFMKNNHLQYLIL